MADASGDTARTYCRARGSPREVSRLWCRGALLPSSTLPGPRLRVVVAGRIRIWGLHWNPGRPMLAGLWGLLGEQLIPGTLGPLSPRAVREL